MNVDLMNPGYPNDYVTFFAYVCCRQNIALFRCQFHVLLEKLRGKGSLLFWGLN